LLLGVMTAIFSLQDAVSGGAYNEIYDRHNFAYMLRHKAQVHVATYHAKLIFHLKLPDWQISFRDLDYNCRSQRNMTVIETSFATFWMP